MPQDVNSGKIQHVDFYGHATIFSLLHYLLLALSFLALLRPALQLLNASTILAEFLGMEKNPYGFLPQYQ